MTVEEVYNKLYDELTAENESSKSPERTFIKNEEQTICTLTMNRSHEIIFVEFKPSPKDLAEVEREPFVYPHPVEMLHDAGWRQAQITTWEEAEKLLDIIRRSYKRKRPKAEPVARAAVAGKGAAGVSQPRKRGRTPKVVVEERPPKRILTAAAKPKPRRAGRSKATAKAKIKAKSKAKVKTRAKLKVKPVKKTARKIKAPKKATRKARGKKR